ncbi:MAG: hypothetical protein GYA51_18335 [Candidatus Methanofastidiosa archaeon]|nr:hypothetical protein [Candidatus Methanofastidiosa archaeon]
MKTRMDDTDDIQIQELINQMICTPDKFKHLQIFLQRDRKIDYGTETEFLMVSPRCFGKVEITDLIVQDDTISVEFLDCATQDVGYVHLNIHDKRPNTIFINWNDLKSLVGSGVCSSIDNSGLLEFDF